MLFQPSEAIGRENPRPVHINDLTAWVDLSQVYGSDPEVAEILRGMLICCVMLFN